VGRGDGHPGAAVVAVGEGARQQLPAGTERPVLAVYGEQGQGPQPVPYEATALGDPQALWIGLQQVVVARGATGLLLGGGADDLLLLLGVVHGVGNGLAGHRLRRVRVFERHGPYHHGVLHGVMRQSGSMEAVRPPLCRPSA
jgi:hypothetical protein